MENLKALEEILSKPKKSDSKTDRKIAIDALYQIYKEQRNFPLIASYLNQLHYATCSAFFDRICLTSPDEDIINMAEALVKDELFQTGLVSNIMYPKGFSAVFALAKKEKYSAAFLVMNYILMQSEKSGIISDGCISSFNKLSKQSNSLAEVLKIYDLVVSGDIESSDYSKGLYARFLKAIESSDVKILPKETSTTPTTPVDMPKALSDKSVSENSRPEVAVDHHVLHFIEKSQGEILSALRTIVDNKSTIDMLTNSLISKEDELGNLRNEVAHTERQNLSLTSEVDEMIKKNEDLTERLRTALQMDGISKSQELTTLKNDVSEALKLEYADYTKSRERPCGEDLFEAYRAMLSRIFKVLRRYGISCE